jgi:hypothetical protein
MLRSRLSNSAEAVEMSAYFAHDTPVYFAQMFKGELTDDGAQVMWDVENQSAYSWTPEPAEPIVESSSGEQITIGDQQFTKMDEEEALEQYSADEC